MDNFKIKNLKLADGSYTGVWSGSEIAIDIEGGKLLVETEDGIRGAVHCTLVVSGSSVTLTEGRPANPPWMTGLVTTEADCNCEITVDLDTPNGPVVEYGPDDDEESVEASLPPGWAASWGSPAYKLSSGRYRLPLIRE